MTAPPGSVIYDSVAVVNQSNAPLDLALYSADAQNASDGTIGLPDRTVKPTAAGSWITVGASTVTVPPQSTKGIGYTVVPITIAIPADAEPGDHVAGVVTSLTARGTAKGGDQSATVNLEQRVGLRIYVTVAGPVKSGLVITNVKATYHQADLLGLAGAGSATVTYTLSNTGNVRLGVHPSVRGSGQFGLLARSAAGSSIDDLLPGSSVEQTVTMPNVWPLVLESVRVSATAVAATNRDDPGIGTVTRTGHTWAVPWAWLAIVLIVVGVWLLLRRRRRRPGSPPPGGRHSGTVTGAPVLPPTAATETHATSEPLPETQAAL
jgi:hypothetical protein